MTTFTQRSHMAAKLDMSKRAVREASDALFAAGHAARGSVDGDTYQTLYRLTEAAHSLCREWPWYRVRPIVRPAGVKPSPEVDAFLDRFPLIEP